MGQSNTENLPLIPVSWGELMDKISILEIKRARILAPDKIRDVEQDLANLRRSQCEQISSSPQVQALCAQLKETNEALWDLEIQIRACEKEQRFDETFVSVARSIYQTNDRRSQIKRELDCILGSPFTEVKDYST